MVACNTRQVDSVIDVANDGLGLRAIETAMEVAENRRSEILFRVAAYSPLGFQTQDTEAWALMQEAAKVADLIGALPERDDQIDYPHHIGYEESCRRVLALACENNKPLQVHTDQVNHPNENGTERLLDVIESEGIRLGTPGQPQIWAVHMISPTGYDDARWNELVDRLKAANVGVICCPSAALGMRQLRPIQSPTSNSIARVLELCAAGISLRLGSDNLDDMLSPSTTPDLTDEVFVLSAALRFYDVAVLAKLACGTSLDAQDVQRVTHHLEVNDAEMAQAAARWSKA